MAYQDDDRFDRVKSVAKAALAVGAGAAFLYRGGGNELLSKGLKRTTAALNDSIPSLTSRSLSDLNGNAKQAMRETYDSFRNAYRNNSDVKASLRLDSSNSLLNTLQIENNLKSNPNAFLRNMFTREEFIPGIKRELQGRLDDFSPRRINNIVDDITTHIADALDNEGPLPDDYTLSKKFKKDYEGVLNEEQVNTIEEVIQERFKAKRQDTDAYIAAHRDMIENINAELLNYDSLEDKFGSIHKKNKSQDFMDWVLGDRQATIRDIVENADQIEKTNLISEGTQNPIDVLERARQLMEKDERYGDLFVDKSLRIDDNGIIRSYAEFANLEQEAENKFLHTLPGKLLKPLEARVYKNSSPNLWLSAKGSTDYLLPKLLEGEESTTLKNSYMRLNNKGYKVVGNELRRESKMDDLFLTSGTYGSYVRLYKNITGDVDYSTKSRNILAEKLDIGSTPKLSAFENFKLKFAKFQDPEWAPNLINNKLKEESRNQNPFEYFEDMKEINRVFKRTTSHMDKTTVARLSNFNQDKATREIFDLLLLDDENLLKAISNQNTGGTKKYFLNEDAISIIERYKRDPKAGRSIVSITQDTKSLGVNLKHTKAERYTDLLRKELDKEAMLRYKQAYGGDSLMSMLNQVPLNNAQRKNAKNLASWAVFQEAGEIRTGEISPKRSAQIIDSKTKLTNLFLADPTNVSNEDRLMREEFQKSVRQMAKDSSSIIHDEAGAPKRHLNQIEKANRPNNYIYVRKGISALDVIQDLNNTEKLKSFGKQFVAGRKNMEDFTSYSFYPYFGLFRLTDAIPQLAFSPKNTGNVVDLAKNIMTKRVMPIAGAGFALSYLDYEARNLTGKGLGEAAMNSWANFDLGVRSIIDKTPFAESMKDMYFTNDITNYYSNDPYRSAQEQKEWYVNGVSPVRKGRWWGMSTSEFRGGKIEYFEPNKLRQASTPWKDIGVYGSSEEKWKHSIIPTLRHPLSPVRYLLNPYWLEEKNKFSRPYPVTAPMFSEGTPWGGILNMTVGEAIKPQRRMHREVLGNDFVDVRDLISRQNDKIKSRAAEDDKYIMLTDSNSATDERHFSLAGVPNLAGSPVIGGDQIDLNTFNKESGKTVPFAPVANQYSSRREDNKITFVDKLFMATMDTGLIMPQLEDINAQIRRKASTRGMSETNYAKRYDALTAADSIDIVRDKDISADLRNMTSTKEYIKDIGYSAKQLSGIYGFMLEEVVPSKRQHVLANASSMSSFSRRFWDESYGGLGGGFMEIARRFFPHANRDNIEVNTIQNSMPSWMPDSFKHGDPYTKVKKGEMRLPGQAYEAMNHYTPNMDFTIHPYMIGSTRDALVQYYLNKKDMDEYFNSLPKQDINASVSDLKKTEKGIEEAQKVINKMLKSGRLNSGEFYDDFQRFKILADVAPYSDEYKIYKSKMRQQLNDTNTAEYNAILNRVEKQSKQHEFYNYRYLNMEFTEQEAYIDQVTKDGFTVVGSNKLYSLAGVKTTQEGVATQLSSGMKVKLRYDSLDAEDDFIKTIVFNNGTNINKELISSKVGERHTNGDAIDAHAIASPTQKTLGAMAEIIGHAPIPFLHNRYLKLETPLESYRNDQVYGTPYATWSHPIQGYIEPAFNKAVSVGGVHAGLGIAAFAANLYFNDITTKTFKHGELIKKAAEVSNLIITPGAATGALVGFGTKLGFDHVNTGMKIGSAVWGVGYLATNAHNPLVSVGAGLSIGKAVGEFLEKGTGNKAAITGAAIGLGISYLKNPDFNFDKMTSKWIPKRTEKRWEMEEYFDRLSYIKYKGLYEKASRDALRKEGVNIKQLLSEMEQAEEKSQKEKEKLLKYKQKISNSYISNTDYGKGLLRRIDSQLIDPLESKVVKAGEYTKSAIAYKQAMDSTIYGLKENASWAQILRALPKNDRDYFLEFAKVKDKKEQDKILKTISPYKRKILQNIWGRPADKLESNNSFFSSHKLPGLFWEGWKPNVDMDHIQMKTIENEGMLLSDFGFYDSNKDEPGYSEVASVNYEQDTNLLALKANLFSSLNGLGLTGVNVSIEPSQMPGIQMVADFARISDFKIKQKINSTFGRTYY